MVHKRTSSTSYWLFRLSSFCLGFLVLPCFAADADGSESIFDRIYDATQGATFQTIFENLDKSLNHVYPVLIGLCYLLGSFFVLKAFFMLKKMGYKTAFMHAGSSLIGPAGVLMIGIILMYTPQVLKILFLTLYGNAEVTSVSAWSGPASGGGTAAKWERAIEPMIGLIQVIGLCAFIKGWVQIMKSTGENAPPGNLSKGLLHVFAGVLAINITGTMDVINHTLGL